MLASITALDALCAQWQWCVWLQNYRSESNGNTSTELNGTCTSLQRSAWTKTRASSMGSAPTACSWPIWTSTRATNGAAASPWYAQAPYGLWRASSSWHATPKARHETWYATRNASAAPCHATRHAASTIQPGSTPSVWATTMIVSLQLFLSFLLTTKLSFLLTTLPMYKLWEEILCDLSLWRTASVWVLRLVIFFGHCDCTNQVVHLPLPVCREEDSPLWALTASSIERQALKNGLQACKHHVTPAVEPTRVAISQRGWACHVETMIVNIAHHMIPVTLLLTRSWLDQSALPLHSDRLRRPVLPSRPRGRSLADGAVLLQTDF